MYVRHSVFTGGGFKAAIEFGDGGPSYRCVVEDCLFRNLNSISQYSSCYALYYNGVPQVVRDSKFLDLNYYTVANNLNGFRFIGIEDGDAIFKNSGTATFSGDDSTTDFEIGAHGLVITDPSKIAVKITPVSSDAIAASPCVGYVDPADNTKIRVKFSSAPASGSENVKIVWYAEVIS